MLQSSMCTSTIHRYQRLIFLWPLALSFSDNESALKLAGIDNFKDKVVIDASNPLDFSSG